MAQLPTIPDGTMAAILIETGHLNISEDGSEVARTREVRL